MIRQNQIYSDFLKEIQSLTFMLRKKSMERSKKKKIINVNRPNASWIKEDRMFDCIGSEFVVILRTCGCKWARSGSGGCTMCGYFNDCAQKISQDNIISQFEFTLQKYSEKIKEKSQNKEKIAIKLYTSGSFLDEEEITSETRQIIFEKIAGINCVKEVIIETRPEFVNVDKLNQSTAILKDKILVLGIGVESSNKFIREILVNKGFTFEDVKKAINIAHNCGVRVKIYLLLKPPFISEKIAIKDAVKSINDVIEIGADSISLNPVNIQSYTVAETLYYRKKYRPPWIYSIISVFKQALNKKKMKNVLILCDPSAAGKERGTHNCYSKECNRDWLKILKKFIFTQDLSVIDKNILPIGKCKCWGEYNLFLEYSKH